MNDFDFRSNSEVLKYCEEILHLEDIDELDHNELVEKIVNSYTKKDMTKLLDINEIFDVKFKKIVSIRNAYLQKIKVFDQAGNYLDDINIDDDEIIDDDSFSKVAQFDKHQSFIKKLPKSQQKLLLEHMNKTKTSTYTLDSYNQDKRLKSKLSNATKKIIRNFFAKEQNQIDLMTETDSFDNDNDDSAENVSNESALFSDDEEDNEDYEDSHRSKRSTKRSYKTAEDDEEDDDFDDIFGINDEENRSKRKKSSDDSSVTTIETRSKKARNSPTSSPPSKAMLLVSPRVKQGKRKSLTPKKAYKKKSDYSKVNVHVSVKIPKQSGEEDEGVYYLIVTTENDKGEGLFAWRPSFLKEVFECFQDDYEEGDYWREQVLFDCYEQCDKPKSDNQALEKGQYPAFVLVIQLEVTPEILKKALPNHNSGISTEHLFVKTMFDCFWNNMVKDSKFEPRLVNCIEKTYLPKDKVFDDTYPRRRLSSYASSLARCLAQDLSTKKKRSDNFDKLDNPEQFFHFNVPLSDHIITSSLKVICSELQLKRSTKKEIELVEKFTGFKVPKKEKK